MNEACANEYPSQYDALRQQLNAQQPLPAPTIQQRLREAIACLEAKRGRPLTDRERLENLQAVLERDL